MGRAIPQVQLDQFCRVIDTEIEKMPYLVQDPYGELMQIIRDSATLFFGRHVRRSLRIHEPRQLWLVRQKLRLLKNKWKNVQTMSDFKKRKLLQQMYVS